MLIWVEEAVEEVQQCLEAIQAAGERKQLDIKQMEPLYTGRFADAMGLGLEVTKGSVIEVIADTVLKSVSEGALEAEEYKLAESFAYVIKRILSVSRETKDGEMIHNLIIVLLVLSSCLNEKEAGYLATTIFTS